MRRTRLSMKKFKSVHDDSSNDVALEYDIKADKCDLSESSSESDIETCTKATKELNLSSSSFVTKPTSARESNFAAIEADIFSGINRLSDSDSEIETTQVPIGIHNFKDIELYNAKLNDAKKSVEKYEAKERPEPSLVDINNLLAAGEYQKEYAQSSDCESYSDEQDDWEEIKNEKAEDFQNEGCIKDVEITVELPGGIAKKKGVDLMASIKRRLNRVKKELQIYVHKVHLLCWIAHGNYINTELNRDSVQAIALSLLPSQHCYPSSRLDLSYLEQILTWYRKTVNYIEQKSIKPVNLEESLQLQMHQKEASSKTIFVYIFICILRSLGINVRLVLNLLVEPLRPRNSELCSVSTKPSTVSKDLKNISEASTSALSTKKCEAVPTASTIKDKLVTPASKLCKLVNNSNMSKAKLISKENSRTDSVPLKRKANVGRQSQEKKSNEPSLSTFKEKSNSTVNKTKMQLISSKNIKSAEDKSNEKLNTSENCSSSLKRMSDIDFSKDINSTSKSSKKDNKLNINKRLSEKSVNIFPSTRSHVDEDITTKKQSPNVEDEDITTKKQSPNVECETVILPNKLLVKSKSKKQLTGEGNAVTNEKTSTSSLKLNSESESKKNASKRTSSSNIEKASTSALSTKKCEAVPSTSTIKDKLVTPASKLCKLVNNSDMSKAKLISKENSRTDSVPLKRKANVGRQSQEKKSNEPSLSTFKEKGNSTVNKTKMQLISSKNIKSAEEKSNEKVNTSENCSSSLKQLSDIDFSKDINSTSKSSKKDNKLNINKRLSEKSVNIFPSTRSRVDEDITTKKQYPNVEDEDITTKKQSPNVECETVILTNKLLVKPKPKKQLTAEGNAVTNEKTSASSLKLNSESESKKNASKRTSSSNIEKGSDQKRLKKRKGTVIQLDGPNSSTDESDYNDFHRLFTIPQLDGNDQSESENKSKPNLRKLSLRSQPSKSEGYKKGENASLKALQNSTTEQTTATKKSIFSNYFSSPDTKGEKISTNVRPDIIHLVKTSISQAKQRRKSGRQRNAKSLEAQVESDSDSDFVPMSAEKKKPRDDYLAPHIKVKRRVLPRKELDKQALNDEENDETKKKGIDIWVEIFLEAEEKWISVDVLKGQIHCVKEIYSRASHPNSYILSWDNSNYIKDVTKRYCTTNWNTVTRKLRVEPEWWSQTLKPFESPKTAKQREEDEELEQQQMDQPLPKAITEYKNHPLYVLKRHLLKFEGIYPADAPALGFIRNEAVYSRMCVHTLHSREIWLKHAKVVRLGETAYKIVKARPKYDRYSNTFITDQPLEIFGSWQVGDYIPPTAENGIVPKNAYGNVELFKKCMLPKGTVHLDLPGLQKVARKLSIDCPPAVIGFDFHGGWSHPTFEGFVVCEEFADILSAAWDQEQQEAEKREGEKIDKRVYGNWRKLIKGLLIRERLQRRYDFGRPSTSEKKHPKLVLKKNRLCSDSDSD